jgi:hypothetical protein
MIIIYNGKHWLTVLRKRLQNICTKKYARNLGYSADEVLTAEGMIAEEYKGIRPAPGYPPVLTI